MIDKKFSAGYEDISVTVVDYQKNALRNTQMKLIN